jgi:hypothetical protein
LKAEEKTIAGLVLGLAFLPLSDTNIQMFQYYATHNTIYFLVVGGGY